MSTRASARHAVIEAKGLEYPHVVLLGLVSGQRAAYAEVFLGVAAQDLARDVHRKHQRRAQPCPRRCLVLVTQDATQTLQQRAAGFLRQRHLQPYAAKNFKEIPSIGPTGASALSRAIRFDRRTRSRP